VTSTASVALIDEPKAIVGVGMKMFLGYAESLRYLTDLAAAAGRLETVSLFVLPSLPLMPAAKELFAKTGIAYGAQDGHWQDSGPHTGSVSPAMLAELGCSLMEVGHAERRRDFGEDNAMTGRKAAAAARWGLVPLVCVGEQHETAQAEVVVQRQVDAVFAELPDDGCPVVIAYEPVWAIGAERTATAEHVERVVHVIRAVGAGRKGTVKVVYGGSVVPERVGVILAAGADGVFASRSVLSLPKLERVIAQATRPA
jgi:triosephosphate isomerase